MHKVVLAASASGLGRKRHAAFRFGEGLMGPETPSVLKEWREQLWSTYVRLESASDDDRFFGRVERMNPTSARLSRVVSTRQVTDRTPSHLRSDPQELVLLAVQLSGHGFVEQSGRRVRLDVGDFGVYETTRPYRLAFDGPFEQLIVRLPRRQLNSRLPQLSHMTARRYEGGRGPARVAVDFLRQLSHAAQGLTDQDLESFESAAADVVATAMQLQDRGEDYADRARIGRVQSLIMRELRDPGLGVERIAAAEGLSVRSLQRLFQIDGETPMRWILVRRLDRVASDLRDPRYAFRSITDIALSWGFNDLSHFTRAFRGRFKASPRAWRRG